ncbi:MAG: hypothetical protein EOP45_14510 [Sphingobacteriaceae bacterium]|nr:MAG: hypothetical protein EOP45_14510 [Sphingobacteriaceae bacterium]
MNKNFKEEYLKVKDIKDDQCLCIDRDFLEQLAVYVNKNIAIQNWNIELRNLSTNDSLLSSHTSMDPDLLLGIFRKEVKPFPTLLYVSFRCLEPFACCPKSTSKSKHLELSCEGMEYEVKGLQRKLGTKQGMDNFIQILIQRLQQDYSLQDSNICPS